MENREKIKEILKEKIDRGENDLPSLIELARSCKKAGNRSGYLYLLQVLEREDIAENLAARIEEILGKEARDKVFTNLTLPPRGAPPEEALPFTEKLMENLLALEREEDGPEKREIYSSLAGNAHAIPPEAFAKEKAFFRAAPSLEAYLKGTHERAVQTLQEHADSGEVWFEQVITQDVVEFVRTHREILGGVLTDGKIYLTKIPYRPAEWLTETDKDKKRYLACHCPMAREALNGHQAKIPRLWCACSAGFAKQKFNALFEEDLETKIIASVLDGDDVCRFAISVPERFL